MTLQKIINLLRKIFPRGWTPFLKILAILIPSLRKYKILLKNGDSLHVDLSDEMSLGYFYFGGHPHEPGTARLFKRYIKKDFVVMDVGANIGYYTKIASSLCGPKGKVLSFEPLPRAYHLLKTNTRKLENTIIHECALSDSIGNEKFYIKNAGDTSSLLKGDVSQNRESIEIEVRKGDEFIKSFKRLDFLKIDVEGYELRVLKGLQKSITKHRPLIIFEFLLSYSKAMKLEFEDFEIFFKPLDYLLKHINHNGSELFSAEPTNMIVAIPNEVRRSLD